MPEETMTFRDDGNPGPVVAEAGEPDIPVLARHHRLMFEEIWEKRGNTSPEGCMQAMEEQYKQKLRDGFRDGSCHAWVVRKDSRIIASGAVSVVPYVPVPYDPGFSIAFIHSVYTEKGERHRKYADRVVKTIVQYCRDRGICRVYLFASEDGRPVYEKNGFTPVDNTMLAVLK